MGVRRQARECALQMLYQLDLGGCDMPLVSRKYWMSIQVPDAVQVFADDLADGVAKNRDALDEVIAKYSANWKLSRMSAVDKNILRIAAYELKFCEDIPSKVTINEAVDIAKRFGTAESGAFVNGILDNMAKTIAIDKEDRSRS
jgi:transcription antitermination protein NusB